MPSLDELMDLWREAGALGADVLKVAAPVADAWQTLPLVRLAERARYGGGPAVLPVALGAAGRFLRVLTAKLAPRAPLCFAARDGADPPLGAGQLSWRSMVGRWRFDQVGPDTPVWAVVGRPVGFSWSPRVHNALLDAAGQPGVYVRLPVARAPAAFLAAFAAPLGLRGLSVTSPHKEALARACRRLDPAARAAGAVNTLVRDRDGWRGGNGDGEAGADGLAAELGALSGRAVALLGSGGTARALAAALVGRGAVVYIVSRDLGRAQALAGELGCQALARSALAGRDDVAALVNATPVGMRGGPAGSPLAAEDLPPRALVVDTIYRPATTALLALARARGLPTLGGEVLFARQAARQARDFFGLKVSPDLLASLVADAPGR